MDSSLVYSFTEKGLILLILLSNIGINTSTASITPTPTKTVSDTISKGNGKNLSFRGSGNLPEICQSVSGRFPATCCKLPETYQKPIDGCIQLIDEAMNFFLACNTCGSQNGAVLSLEHLKRVDRNITKSSYDGLLTHGAIWIDDVEPLCKQTLAHFSRRCKVFVTKNNKPSALKNVSCSNEYNFFCYHVGIPQSDSRCYSATADVTSIATSNKSASLATDTPNADDSYHLHLISLIAISAVVGVLVVIGVVVTCCLCRRQKYNQRRNIETREESHVPPLERFRMQMWDSHHYAVPTIGPTSPNPAPGAPRMYSSLRRENQHNYTCLSPKTTSTM